MKHYYLSTELLNHIMCVGTYNTIFDGHIDYDYAVECFLEEHPNFKDGDEYPLDFDYLLNENIIINELGKVLDDNVKPFLQYYGVQDIIIGGWYHPSYYNFETDSLDLTFNVEDNFLEQAEAVIASWQGDKNIIQFITDHFASRDGFLSFCPESLHDLLVEFRSGEPSTQAVGEYITILLHNEFGDSYLQEELENNYLEKDSIVWHERQTTICA